jgi:hypothetical protein
MRGDSVAARAAEDRWHDQDVLGRYWAKLFRELDSTFKSYPSDSDKPVRLRLRDSVYAAARTEMVDSLSRQLRGIPAAYLQRIKLDNATLMGRRVYASDLDVFEAVFEIEGRSLRGAVETIIAVASNTTMEPATALREWVNRKRK